MKNKNKLERKISALEKCANEAYLNSVIPELLLYSSNKYIKTRTSEAIRYASLEKEIKATKFALECLEVEEKLPDFEKMSMEEIQLWTDGGDPLHWCPCGTSEEEYVILHEEGKYYLAVIRYSEDGWIAEARGVRITPHITEVLTKKGFYTVEN